MKKKGQVNIYFIVSIVLFLTLTTYLIYAIIDYNRIYRENIMSDILYTKSYSISDLLIRDGGYPENWNSTNFDRVGLASEPYSLNLAKINELEKICNSSAKIKKLKSSFGLMDEDLIIKIDYLNKTNVLDCSPESMRIGRIVSIKRIATLNNNFVEVNVYVG